MASPLQWLGRILAGLVLVLVLAAAALFAISQQQLRRRYTAPSDVIPIRTDSASLARGEYLARASTSCTLCHGEDGGGMVYADMGPMGRIVGPNLTRGSGGAGSRLTDEEWIRAVRYGIRSDGTSLIVMPSEVFVNLTDIDLGSILGYYRSLPPIDRELPTTRFGPLGRALLAAGKFNILTAPKTPRQDRVASITPSVTPEYGRYLAAISGCFGCHGHGLSGGRVAGPPDLPPASNLTPSGLGTWTEADFTRAMREGQKPGGAPVNEFMPWKVFRHMTDDDIRALWLYLQSVPPREFGNK